MDGIAATLAAIDDTMRKSLGGGAPGSGLLYLLNHLATTQLGAPHTTLEAESTTATEPMPEAPKTA